MVQAITAARRAGVGWLEHAGTGWLVWHRGCLHLLLSRQRLTFREKSGPTDLSPLEVEVLERGATGFPCERPAAPYQEERELMISPLVGWAALALLHRLWPVGVIVGLTVVALAVWRMRARGRRDSVVY